MLEQSLISKETIHLTIMLTCLQGVPVDATEVLFREAISPCSHHALPQPESSMITKIRFWWSALQDAKSNESFFMNSMRARLTISEKTTDAACQQSRLDCQAAHDLEQRLQQATQAKKSSQRRLGALADMLTFTSWEMDHAEERLATAQILISGLEKSLSRAQHDRDSNVVSHVKQCDGLSAQLAEALSAKTAAEAQLGQFKLGFSSTPPLITYQLS